MSTLYSGLDLGLDSITHRILLQDGSEPAKSMRVPYTPLGLKELFDCILKIADSNQATSLQIGIESTGVLAWHVCDAIRDYKPLQRLAPKIYLINPRLVSSFKAALGAEGKTDKSDAYAIAERVRFGKLTPLSTPDDRYLALQKLTRHRFHLVNTLVAEKNRFLDHLFLKFSGFRQNGGSDAFGQAVSALLTDSLTVEEIAKKDLPAIVEFLRQKSGNRFPKAEEVAAAIQEAAKQSHRLRKSLIEPLNSILAMTLENIRFFERQIARVDKLIAQQLAYLPLAPCLLSIPGIGPVFAAGILAEVQDIHRFPSETQVAKFAGLAWKRLQTGRFEADDTPLSHSGNHYLRYYLVEAVNSLRICNEEYRAFYQAKYREAKTHQHKRASVLTARKFVRLVDTLLRNGQLYQPSEHRKEDAATPNGMSPGEIARHAARRRQARRQATAGR